MKDGLEDGTDIDAEPPLWREASPGSGVYVHEYDFRKFGPANSLAVLTGAGRLAVVSPPPAPGASLLNALARIGRVEAIVIPNIGHTAGQREWRAHFPAASLYAPDDIAPMLENLKIEGAKKLSSLGAPEGVRFIAAPGSRTGATFVISALGARPVVYLDEILITMKGRPRGLMMKILFAVFGVGKGASVNRVFVKMLCKDPSTLKAAARGLLAGDPVILPAHGPAIIAPQAVRAAMRLLDD